MIKLILILMINLLLSLNSFADVEIGRIVNLRGEVLRSNAAMGVEAQPLKAGAQLYAGDQLVSSQRSFARILMKDETLFQVGPETTFVVEKFDFKQKNDRQATYNLVAGRLRSVFTQKAKENELFIKTPTASMGIRGTEILSDVYRVDGEVRTDIALLSGNLDVMTQGSNQEIKTVTMQPGFVYETKIDLKNQMIEDSEMRRLPQNMLTQLNAPASSGGHTFLFDASVASAPKSREGASFDLKLVSTETDVKDVEKASKSPLKVAPASEVQPNEIKRVPASDETPVLPRKIDTPREKSTTEPEKIEQTSLAPVSEPTRVQTTTVKTYDEPVKLEPTSVKTYEEPLPLNTTTVKTYDQPVKLEPTSIKTFDEPIRLDTTTVKTYDEPMKIDTTTAVKLYDEPVKIQTYNEPIKLDTSTIKVYEPIKYDTRVMTYDEPVKLDPKVITYDEPVKVAPVYQDTAVILREPTAINEPVVINDTLKNVDTVTNTMIQDSFVKEQDRMAQETMIKEQEKLVTETTKTVTKDPIIETVKEPIKFDGGGMKLK